MILWKLKIAALLMLILPAHAGNYPIPAPGTAGNVLTSAGGKWTSALGGSGSGGINYLTGDDTNQNSTVGNWVAYADAAGASPVDGTGGSPTVTCTRTTSTPLRGAGSLLITKDAANRQGNGCSIDFTIDVADQAKPLAFSFDTTVGSGTYADGDLTAWLYDKTNATLIQFAPYKILSVTAGVSQRWIGYAQTSASSTAYRLILHAASTSASAYTVKADNLVFGPTYQPYGAVETDSSNSGATFTFNGLGTVSGQSLWWKRAGNMCKVYGVVETGTVAASTSSITLPFAYDSTKSTSQTSVQGVGSATLIATGAAVNVYSSSGQSIAIFYDGSDTTKLYFGVTVGSNVYTKVNGSTAFNSTQWVRVEFEYPVAGWSSNVQVSSDADTRVVSAQANFKTPTGTISSSYNIVKFGSVDKDTHAGYNTSTGLYTIPVSGHYFCSAQIEIAGTYAAGQYTQVALSRNGTPGTSDTLYGSVRTYGAGASFAPAVSGVIYFNAGDTLGIYSLTGATGGPSFSTAMNGSNFSINRLSGPAQIAASESVNARYYASATTINGSLATVSWTTKDYDSHGGMSSGTYTIPVAGKYQVNTALALSGTFALNNQSNLVIQKNGVTVSELLDYAAGAETADHVFLSDIISCNQGDTIRVQVSSGATGPAIVSSNTKNYFSISRVGN
jgi:hypothetical protein